MELFASQDPRSYSLYFEMKIWFRARKFNGTFEKQVPDQYSESSNNWETKVLLYTRRRDLCVASRLQLET